MKTAEQLMETSPDSALHLLLQIKPNQSLSSADQALYGLLLFEALDKKYLPLQPDSAINFSLNYYQNKNDKEHLAKSYFYKGRMFKYAQRYDEATEVYLKALDNCQEKKIMHYSEKFILIWARSLFGKENFQRLEKNIS